jgi:hypothetical protein
MMACMFDALRKYDALVKAFHEEKAEVVKRLMRLIEEEKRQTERAQLQVVEGPQNIARWEAEVAQLVRLEIVPFEEIMREVKP